MPPNPPSDSHLPLTPPHLADPAAPPKIPQPIASFPSNAAGKQNASRVSRAQYPSSSRHHNHHTGVHHSHHASHHTSTTLPPQPLSQLVNLDRTTAAIISSINNQIKDEDRLQADGSNYHTWCDFIDKWMMDAINRPYYLHSPSKNNAHKRVACSVFLTSLNCSLH